MTKQTTTHVKINPDKVTKRKRTPIKNLEFLNNGIAISTVKSDLQNMQIEVDSATQSLIHEDPIKEGAAQKKGNRKLRERKSGSIKNPDVLNSSDTISAAKSNMQDMPLEIDSATRYPVSQAQNMQIEVDSATQSLVHEHLIKEDAVQIKGRRSKNRKFRERMSSSIENPEVLNSSDSVSVAKSNIQDMPLEVDSATQYPVSQAPRIDIAPTNNLIKQSAAPTKKRKKRRNKKKNTEKMSSSVENPEAFNDSKAKSDVQDMPQEVDSVTQYLAHQVPKGDTDLTNIAIKDNLVQLKNRKMTEKMQDVLLEVDSAPQSVVQEAPIIDIDSNNKEAKESTLVKKKKRRRNRRANKLSMSMDEAGIRSTNQKDIRQAVEGLSTSGKKNFNTSATESMIEGKFPSFDMIVTKDVPLDITNTKDQLSEVSHPLTERSLLTCSRRKLLILDLNGLLADIVCPPPKVCKADINILGRAVFKRPFCYDFLKFCFEKFYVGVWSSRTKRVIDRVVDYLLGDLKHKLLFCWDMSHCRQTNFKTLENNYKPVVFKELRKLWERHDPNLPWNKGDYNESNTLLLDDSPYKALLNPMNSAIFPYSYKFTDRSDDNSLGPGGDLRVYLEDLAAAENIQKYIEHHPFGQNPITDASPSWDFYHKVISSQSCVPTRR